MMKISACWIAKNEEANLGLSIESVKDIADELIVVDTGSTDGTVALARSHGARVEYFEWINDFSAARNYALSFATGDIIIFLDADEWFEPKLGSAEKGSIVDHFANDPLREMISIKIINLDRPSGKIKDINLVSRIYRNDESLRFRGRIHELINPTHKNGNTFFKELSINHSGYSSEVVGEKFKRNRVLLQEQLEKEDIPSKDKVRDLIYITRENFFLGNQDEAIEYLVELLKHPKDIYNICSFYNIGFSYNIYVATDLAKQKREQISRRDIYDKLIKMFENVYKNYNGAAEIDLLYRIYFDFKEDRLLKEIGPAIEAAGSMGATTVSVYKDYEKKLYEQAALAARRRGEALLAMEYAVSAFGDGENRGKADLFAILLNTVKGQPPEDIVLFLNSIFDITNAGDLAFLIQGTGREGFNEIHAYYLKKRKEMGNAPFDDFLRLMLLYSKYDELIVNAAEAYDAGQEKAAEYIFLAALCGAPAGLIHAHADKTEQYAHILQAFYNGESLAEVTDEDATLLGNTYITVAFMAGMEAADRYLDVFRADRKLCYQVKAVYCEMCGLAEHILAEPLEGIAPLDFSCKSHRIQAMLHTGRHTEALWEIESFLQNEIVEQELLHMLLVVAEQAAGEAGAKAQMLYDRYIELYDAIIDMGDVVNTGIVFDDGGKKKKRYFTNMDNKQLERLLAEEAGHIVTGELLELYRKAAEVYKEKGLLAEAAHCLIRLLAHGRATAQDRENLAEIFAAQKNSALAEHIRGI